MIVEHDDFGKMLEMRNERVDADLPEPAAEGEMLFGRDVLVAEEDDLAVHQRVVDGGHGRVVERPGEIDAANFGADSGFRGNDLDFGFPAVESRFRSAS